MLLGFASEAKGQVISLLVGNQTSFNALDYYAFPSGAYQGPFAGPATPGPPGVYYFTYGPDGNLYRSNNPGSTPVFKHDGMTGNFISTFVPDNGGGFTFGPDGHFYRVTPNGNGVLRYNGQTGQLLGTFVASGLTNALNLHFGPSGDLFVADGNTIKRVDGSTGTVLGPFTPPGAGGLASALDFLFTPNGKLLVSGTTGPPNDRVLEFNALTGEFVGVFAQGNGLDVPLGMTLGPDGNVYVASTLGNSIKRFNVSTGLFLGDFISLTAHPNPTLIEFTPFPIPEPSSCLLVATAMFAGLHASFRKRN
jgi:WD40 repeat protein